MEIMIDFLLARGMTFYLLNYFSLILTLTPCETQLAFWHLVLRGWLKSRPGGAIELSLAQKWNISSIVLKIMNS